MFDQQFTKWDTFLTAFNTAHIARAKIMTTNERTSAPTYCRKLRFLEGSFRCSAPSVFATNSTSHVAFCSGLRGSAASRSARVLTLSLKLDGESSVIVYRMTILDSKNLPLTLIWNVPSTC